MTLPTQEILEKNKIMETEKEEMKVRFISERH